MIRFQTRSNLLFFSFVVFVLLLIIFQFSDFASTFSNYFVMIDAGSTGTRIYIFTWKQFPKDFFSIQQPQDLDGLPLSYKIEPGLMEYRENPQLIYKTLTPLLNFAKEKIPSTHHANTPIFVRATGGLRVLPLAQAEALLASVYSLLKQYPFQVSPHHVSTISGIDEAIYGWISVNYLLGNFQKEGRDERLVGALDMGGVSTQISFLSPVGFDSKFCGHHVYVLGQEYNICAFSLSNFGLTLTYDDYIDTNIQKALLINKNKVELGCLPSDYKKVEKNLSGNKGKTHIREVGDIEVYGQGDFQLCTSQLYPILQAKLSVVDERLLIAKSAPMISQYVAFSGFSRTQQALHLPSHPSLHEWEVAGKRFCKLTTNDLEERQQMLERCFYASWLYLLMTHAYQFPIEQRKIFLLNKNETSDFSTTSVQPTIDLEVGWSLGATLAELSRIHRGHSFSQSTAFLVVIFFGIALVLFFACFAGLTRRYLKPRTEENSGMILAL